MHNLYLYGESKDDLEALMITVKILTDDITMTFDISKCATLVRKRKEARRQWKQVSGGITREDLVTKA